MSVPQNQTWAQGQGSVPGDFLNTAVQTVANVAGLRAFIGLDQMEILLQGFVSMSDGGQGAFGYDADSSATDDGGVTCVQPTAAGPTGRWLRIPPSTGGGGQLSIARAPLYLFDGGGSALVAPLIRAFEIPFALTINSVTLLADQTGAAVVDIGVVPYASYTGVFAGSITASDMPTLATTAKYQDTTLIGWTLAIPANSALIFKLVSVSTITWLSTTLGCVG